jgi:hypothetical protein
MNLRPKSISGALCKVFWLLLAVSLLPLVAPPAASQTPSLPSETAAASLERKILAIGAAEASRHGTGETVLVSELELESYALYRMSDDLAVRLEGLDLEIRPGRVAATADMFVDSDLAATSPIVGPLFEGAHSVYFEGRFEGRDGVGRFELEGVRVDGVPVPVFLVKALLGSLEHPIDIDAPFDIPVGIEEVTLLSRSVSVTY